MKTMVVSLLAISFISFSFASDGFVGITANYPGGNVKIIRQMPGVVEVEPDLRDTSQPWFYWNFEAKAETPGKVKFLFPVNRLTISVQGPAVSRDNGNTWAWLGSDQTTFLGEEADGKRDSFVFEFEKTGETVRFSQSIPYLQKELDSFLKEHEKNSNVSVGGLTKSRKGSDVLFIRIGEDAPGILPVLVTARHHACESMASYVLEGFLREAASDSYAGCEFRKRYVLYAVPFVDTDGVQAGDQGKGRTPHDHNRDYGKTNLYPEIAALQKLDDEKKFAVAMDFHCPSVRNDVHESFYFDGLRMPHINAATEALMEWFLEERPRDLECPVINLLRKNSVDPNDSNAPFAHYFATRPHNIYASTLEVPYANKNLLYTAEMARRTGQSLLRAFIRVKFTKENEPDVSFKEFSTFRTSLVGSPVELVQRIDDLKKKGLPPCWTVEADLRKGWAYFVQNQYDAALKTAEDVLSDPEATERQRGDGILLKMRVIAGNPQTAPEQVNEVVLKSMELPLSRSMKHELYEIAYVYFTKHPEPETALKYAREQLVYANDFNKGKIMNRIAALLEERGEVEKALDVRRAAVKQLKSQLEPVAPVGVFGPSMAYELVLALKAIPGSKPEDISKAAAIALNHHVCPPDIRAKLSEYQIQK